MVLPLIPLVFGAASLAAGALGLKKGFNAKKTMEKAREIGERSQSKYRKTVRELDEKRELVNKDLEALGEYKKEVFKETLGYIVQQVKNARSSAGGIEQIITSINLREIDIFDRELTRISALEMSGGSTQGLIAGAGGAFGAYGAVGLLASASTGTAISTLSGAAATNATLAWLGGGSLAGGGLGIAGGTWVLGGVVAGPALAIAGYTLASKAEEALTKAEEYKAETDLAIAELEAPKLLLEAIQKNIDDTKYVISNLLVRFIEAKSNYEEHLLNEHGWRLWISRLRGKRYRNQLRESKENKLQSLIVFGKTIKLVIEEPLLDDTGAASAGFNTRITGSVEVEHLNEKLKPCVSCGKEIGLLDRVCIHCNTVQPNLIHSTSQSKNN